MSDTVEVKIEISTLVHETSVQHLDKNSERILSAIGAAVRQILLAEGSDCRHKVISLETDEFKNGIGWNYQDNERYSRNA